MTENELVILIVDDDPGHSELLKINLKRQGVTSQILRFYDGRSVLDFLIEYKPMLRISPKPVYILLLDIRMPGIDGLEILQQIKSDDVFKNLPVIMVTTTEDPLELERCIALGCNSCFMKPVNYALLVDSIRKYTEPGKGIVRSEGKYHNIIDD